MQNQGVRYDKEALKALIREKSLKFGDFILASGKKAKYYLDGKQVTLSAAGAMLIGQGILDLLLGEERFPDAVGGMSVGADPITAAVITMVQAPREPVRSYTLPTATLNRDSMIPWATPSTLVSRPRWEEGTRLDS